METAASMSASLSSEEMERLSSLVPLHTLPEEALNELLNSARLETVAKGKFLFEQGDTDPENVYLLDGRVTQAVIRRVSRWPTSCPAPRPRVPITRCGSRGSTVAS